MLILTSLLWILFLQVIIKKLNEKYDLIHIDGCHNYKVAKQDILNSLKLSKPGTIIIFDDTDQKDLGDLCNEFILSKHWSEIDTKIKYKQCHRFFKVM
uniref:Methyltransferase n=1 Tax=viral metagenome TaxID=1070528 RepID=A0A6C0IVJ6_9ZZZZ